MCFPDIGTYERGVDSPLTLQAQQTLLFAYLAAPARIALPKIAILLRPS
jgi:hypothetical protein